MVRHTTRLRLFRAFLIGSTAIIATGSLSLAQAQTAGGSQSKSFNIPAQSLSDSLATFARVSGLKIAYPAELAQGKSAPALQGSLSQSAALQRLLSNSGLAWRFTGNNAVTVYDPSASNATADAGAPSADGSLVLDTIDVSSGGGGTFSPDTPYQTAGSSTYISSEKIERFRGTSVGDMLSGTPGVLNADNRNGAALDVNIRGMQGQGRVPVIVDGAQQETTVYRGYAGIAGRSYVDPDLIGEVMIEKGPSSAVDGAGVIGGVVRMNTIGVDDILLPGKNVGVRLKGGFNSNSSPVPPINTTGGMYGAGTYPTASLPSSFGGSDGLDRPGFLEPTGGNGSIAAAYKSEHIDLVAAYSRRKNGNYYAGTHGDVPGPIIHNDCGRVSNVGCSQPAPGYSTVTFDGLNRFRAGEEVLNTSQDNKSALLKGTFRLPHDQQIDLGYMRYESVYGEIMPSQILYSENYGAYQAALNSVAMNTYTAKYKWNPPDNNLINFRADSWMSDTDMNVPTQGYNSSDYDNAGNTINRRWGINADNTSTIDTGLGGITLSYGGSYKYETLKPGEGAELNYVRDGNRRELSIFSSGEWKPTDWLTLNASVRYSDYKSNDKQPQRRDFRYYTISDGNGGTKEVTIEEWRALPLPRPTRISSRPVTVWERDDKSYVGDGFAPMVSAMVEPWKGIQFYGKYAEAIRLPSLFETTRGFSTTYNGIALDPEHARTWEFGFNVLRDDVFIAGDKARFKASYFDNNVDDYLTRTALSGTFPIVNIDHATLRGIELSASYDMGRFFGDLAYTHYISTEFCNKPGQLSGQIIDGAPLTALCFDGGTPNSYVINQLPPKDSVSLTLGVRAFDDKLTTGGRLTYIGNRPTSGIGLAGTNTTGGSLVNFEWKPYTLFDLFTSYKIDENFQIDAAIDNVTDQYYMDTLTLGLMASPGRTFRMNMTSKF